MKKDRVGKKRRKSNPDAKKAKKKLEKIINRVNNFICLDNSTLTYEMLPDLSAIARNLNGEYNLTRFPHIKEALANIDRQLEGQYGYNSGVCFSSNSNLDVKNDFKPESTTEKTPSFQRKNVEPSEFINSLAKRNITSVHLGIVIKKLEDYNECTGYLINDGMVSITEEVKLPELNIGEFKSPKLFLFTPENISEKNQPLNPRDYVLFGDTIDFIGTSIETNYTVIAGYWGGVRGFLMNFWIILM